MGERILREYLDHLDPVIKRSLTGRTVWIATAVLLELDDDTREGCIGRDQLAEQVGVIPQNVVRDINALIDSKMIERVLIPTKSGRLVATVRGKLPRFRAPVFCPAVRDGGRHDPAACFPNRKGITAGPAEGNHAAPTDLADPDADADFVATVQAIRSTWAAKAIVQQINMAIRAGCRRDIAWRAMVLMAEDSESNTPGRLMSLPRTPLMAPWFAQAEKEAVAVRKEAERARQRQEAEQARQQEIERRPKVPRQPEEPAPAEPHDPLCSQGMIVLPSGPPVPCKRCFRGKHAQWLVGIQNDEPGITFEEYRRRAVAGELTGTVLPFRSGRDAPAA